MRKTRVLLPLLLVLALLVGGCAAAPVATNEQATDQYDRGVPPSAPTVKEGSYGTGDGSEATDRMIISTVSLVILVEDTNATLTELGRLVQAQEGYISDSQQWLSNEQPYARVTLRVPAAALTATLEAIRGLALRVQSESISGQDVTEEYINLDARIGYLEATQTELLALLTDVRESGGKAEDILAVYDKIMQVGQEIESLKGRQKYLSTMTAMATISVEIQPKAAPVSASGDVEWSPRVTLSRAWRAFVSALKVAVDIVIYLVLFLAIPAALIWLVIWLIRRRNRAKQGETK